MKVDSNLRKLLLMVALYFYFGNILLSQNEAWHWYFGDKTGINFSSGVAAPVNNANMTAPEGSATVGFKDTLLFYTHGESIWDRTHKLMPNGTGLEGSTGASQSSLIIPHPGILGAYFVFTVDADGGANGLKVSVVNMLLNGTLGDVQVKNTAITAPVAEKITAVKHCNNNGYWVIAHGLNNDFFYAILVGKTGINPTPVVSKVGGVMTDPRGYLKASPDGKRLALAITGTSTIEMYNFNDATGVVSNPVSYSGVVTEPYGVEFSPDATKLYFSSLSDSSILQLNLLDGNKMALTRKTLKFSSPVGALQVAVDGKIYIAKVTKPYLGVINFPNDTGSSADARENGLMLNTGLSRLGLPNLIQSSMYVPFNIKQACFGDTTLFLVSDTARIDSVKWDFGDPASGAANYMSGLIGKHKYTLADTFNLKAIVYSGCANDTILKKVVIRLKPIINLGNDTAFCQGNKLDIFITGYPRIDYKWNTGGTGNWITIDTTGLYWVKVSDHGCATYDSIDVVVHPTPVISAISADTSMCVGPRQLFAAIDSGGVAVNYGWSPATYLSDPNIKNPVATPPSTIWYYFNVNTNFGCTAKDSVKIAVVGLPTVDAGPDVYACEGGLGQLNGIATDTFGIKFMRWYPATYLSNSTILNPYTNPPGNQTYVLTVQNQQGCWLSDTVQVFKVKNDVTAIADQVICKGDSIQLDANAINPSTYKWLPNIALSDQHIKNPWSTTTINRNYIITAVDSNGCVAKDTVAITVNDRPILNAGADKFICKGETVNLSASGANNYTWQADPTLSCLNCPSPVATPSTNTTYYVVGSNGTSCDAIDSVKVTVFSLDNMNTSSDTAICIGDSVQLFASGGASYVWLPNLGLNNRFIANPVAKPPFTIDYKVIVTSAGGCKDSTNVLVEVFTPPIANAGNDTIICATDSVQLNATGGTKYIWSPATSLSDSNIGNPFAKPLNNTMYTVTVGNAGGCEAVDSVFVQVKPAIAVTTSADTAICEGGKANLLASGGSNYLWTPAAGLNNNGIANPEAQPAATTTYYVTVSAANQCNGYDSVIVTVNPPPALSISNDTAICEGEVVPLYVSGAANYSWSPAAGLSCTNCPNPIATITSSTAYIVDATDINGCKASDSVKIDVTAEPVINISPTDTAICAGNIVQLSATGGGNYSWLPGIGLSDTAIANPVANPLVTTTYTLTVSINSSCTATDSITITVNEPIAVVAGGDTAICEGEAAAIFAQNGQTYSWSPAATLDDPSAASPLAAPLTSTMYYVTIFDINGCQSTDSVEIIVHPLPVADAGADVHIKKGEEAFLFATGGSKYVWTPDTWLDDPSVQDPIAAPQTNITYLVQVTDANGCIGFDSVRVIIEDLFQLNLPTAFSPNGDGVNDMYKMNNVEGFKLELLQVFNRWGELVFSTKDINQEWDGLYQNVEVPMGTYIYHLSGYNYKGDKIVKSGNITLIR